MDIREKQEMLELVKRNSGAFELAEVTTYIGYRKRKDDGLEREITVQVLDSGIGEPLRWAVQVADEDGRTASGNSGDRLDVVLATVHWGDLDRPAGP